MRFSWMKRFSIVENLFLEGCNRLKSLSYLYIFWAYQYVYLLCIYWSGPDEVHLPLSGALRKIFGVLSMQIGLKCTKKPGLKFFHRACPKTIGRSVRVPMPI